MIELIGSSLQLHPIITAHSHWLSKSLSIPYWTASVSSSNVTCDEWRMTNKESLPNEFSWIHEWTLFYNGI
jgi:hypothetical protein